MANLQTQHATDPRTRPYVATEESCLYSPKKKKGVFLLKGVCLPVFANPDFPIKKEDLINLALSLGLTVQRAAVATDGKGRTLVSTTVRRYPHELKS